jgi:hypothetical protein
MQRLTGNDEPQRSCHREMMPLGDADSGIQPLRTTSSSGVRPC